MEALLLEVAECCLGLPLAAVALRSFAYLSSLL
jgi:hypothetical protein